MEYLGGRVLEGGEGGVYSKVKKNDKQIACVLDEELKKRKDKFKTLEIYHQQKKVYRKFPVFSLKNE